MRQVKFVLPLLTFNITDSCVSLFKKFQFLNSVEKPVCGLFHETLFYPLLTLVAKNKAYIKRKIVPSRQPIFSFDKKYHKKPDLIHVQKLLGNRNVLATQIYVNLEQALLREANDEYHVKVAETVEEAIKLIAVGYEYGSTMGDKQIYRKPKSNGKRGVSIES